MGYIFWVYLQYNTWGEFTIYGVDPEGSRSLRWGYCLRLQRSEAETIREKNITYCQWNCAQDSRRWCSRRVTGIANYFSYPRRSEIPRLFRWCQFTECADKLAKFLANFGSGHDLGLPANARYLFLGQFLAITSQHEKGSILLRIIARNRHTK